MRCLVLAFETLDDLPANWKEFSAVDVYGYSTVSQKDLNKTHAQVRIHNQLFAISNYHHQKELYQQSFIRHPDPWGEPRTWLQAIAALGECLQGKLVCEFWFAHEIIAFDFLLKSLLGSSVRFVEAKQLKNVDKWKNYQGCWKITGDKKNMITLYQEKKTLILQSFYKNVSVFFNEKTTLPDVLMHLSEQ